MKQIRLDLNLLREMKRPSVADSLKNDLKTEHGLSLFRLFWPPLIYGKRRQMSGLNRGIRRNGVPSFIGLVMSSSPAEVEVGPVP